MFSYLHLIKSYLLKWSSQPNWKLKNTRNLSWKAETRNLHQHQATAPKETVPMVAAARPAAARRSASASTVHFKTNFFLVCLINASAFLRTSTTCCRSSATLNHEMMSSSVHEHKTKNSSPRCGSYPACRELNHTACTARTVKSRNIYKIRI